MDMFEARIRIIIINSKQKVKIERNNFQYKNGKNMFMWKGDEWFADLSVD